MFNRFLLHVYLQSLAVWRFYTSLLRNWNSLLSPALQTPQAWQAPLLVTVHVLHGYVRLPSAPNTSMFWTKKRFWKALTLFAPPWVRKLKSLKLQISGAFLCLSWNTWQPREHSHAPPCLASKRGVLHVNESMCLPQWFRGRMPQSKSEAEAFLSIVFRTFAPIDQNLQLIQSFQEDLPLHYTNLLIRQLLIHWCIWTINANYQCRPRYSLRRSCILLGCLCHQSMACQSTHAWYCWNRMEQMKKHLPVEMISSSSEMMPLHLTVVLGVTNWMLRSSWTSCQWRLMITSFSLLGFALKVPRQHETWQKLAKIGCSSCHLTNEAWPLPVQDFNVGLLLPKL